MSNKDKIERLTIILREISANRSWRSQNMTFHHPRAEYIAIDVYEIAIFNEQINKGVDVFTVAKWMEEVILYTVVRYEFKGIRVVLRDNTNGNIKVIHEFII